MDRMFEINVSLALRAFKQSVMARAIGLSVDGLQFTMMGNFFVGPMTISINITPTPIPMGQVTQPHWAFFLNVDPQNYITLRNGAGGTDLPKLFPGEPALFPLSDTATPYGVANAAPALLEYLILSL